LPRRRRSTAQATTRPRTPFFRFPGFASTPYLLNRLAARNIVVFGADLWASDWRAMSPGQELRLMLARLEAATAESSCFTTPSGKRP